MSDTAVSSAAASTETAPSSAASPASSSPVDTASIAASVISDIEQGDGDGADEVVEEKPEKTAASQTTTAQPDDDDFDAVAPERTDALGRKQENRIPHSRVTKMIAKKEKAIIASVAKELGITKAEAELRLEDVTGALTERKTKLSEYEERVKIAEAVEAIMDTDGDRFIRMLADTNPKVYGKFLKVFDQAAETTPSRQSQQAAAADDDPEPPPDYDLGDGRKTYTLEGMRARDEWKERQITKRILGRVEEKLTPYEQERQQREQAQQQQQRRLQIEQDATKKVEQTLERASKWPKFLENEEEIAKVFTANPKMELVDAYLQVVMPKLSTERTTMRQELLAEINGHPNSTSLTSAAATSPKNEKARSTSDVAREVMREMNA